jgi:phage baseplate assembly protein gpV
MNSLLTKLIRWASVVRAGNDADQFPIQQVEYLEKVADCIMIFPYGMHANVDGNSLAVMLALNGALDNRVAIPTSMNRRTALTSGEVTVYSPVTRSAVTFKANGDVVVNANGNLVATATGSATITAPAINLNGAVTIVGGLVADSVAVSGILSQGGTSVGKAHTHSGVQVGGGTSGPVV